MPRSRTARAAGVRTYWMLLVGLGGGIVMIGVVLAFVDATNPALRHRHVSTPTGIVLGGVIAVLGVAGQLVASRLERPLDTTSPTALVQSYRTRFFLWIGLGELPAFVGLFAFVMTGQLVLYVLGAVFAFVSYARIAPTQAHLERDQGQLRHAGSPLQLRTVLETVPSPGPRR